MATINVRNQDYAREHMGFAQYPLVSWRSILAGLIFSVICYVALTALGVALMGASVDDLIGQTRDDASGLAMGTGAWIIISALLSLTVGGYFAARISNLVTGKIGGAQGIVIASLFFSLLLYGAGTAFGLMGRSMGGAVRSMSGTAGGLFSNQVVQDTIEQSFEGLNLKSPPEVVAKGVAARLLRNDADGAKSYLAFQSGVPVTEVDARITAMGTEMQAGLERAAAATAKGMQAAGWTVFLTLFLGVISCVFGGLLGARANNRKPLVDQVAPFQFVPQ